MAALSWGALLGLDIQIRPDRGGIGVGFGWRVFKVHHILDETRRDPAAEAEPSRGRRVDDDVPGVRQRWGKAHVQVVPGTIDLEPAILPAQIVVLGNRRSVTRIAIRRPDSPGTGERSPSKVAA